MRKMQIGSFFFLPSIAALAMLLAGCSTSTTTVVSQEVYNIVWLPNESNGMMAFIDKIYDNVDGSQSEGQNMYQVSSSGSLGNAMFPSDATPDLNYWNAPIISISPNGQTAIMQYGTDIYSVPVSGGNSTDIIQNTSLFGVSLDGKYAATTPTSANNAAYIFTTYDLATNPITINGQRKTIKGLLSNRVLWLNNNEYALTIYDSTGVDSLITTTSLFLIHPAMLFKSFRMVIFSFSAGAYSPKLNTIFMRNHAQGIDSYNLNSDTRTSIITGDTVFSMDVSNDGSVLVYSSNAASTNGSFPAYAVNLSNLDKKQIATNVVDPFISPLHDKVACINQIDGHNSNIQVYGLATPP